MYVCMYVCMYVLYVCKYVCMYLCMYIYVCVYVCMYVCEYVCMYVINYVCLYVCNVRMYVCIYKYINAAVALHPTLQLAGVLRFPFCPERSHFTRPVPLTRSPSTGVCLVTCSQTEHSDRWRGAMVYAGTTPMMFAMVTCFVYTIII